MDEESGEGSEHEFEYEIDEVDEDDAVDEEEEEVNEFDDEEEEEDEGMGVHLDLSAAFCEILRRDRDSRFVDGVSDFPEDGSRLHPDVSPVEGLVDIFGHRMGLADGDALMNAFDAAVSGASSSGIRADPLSALPSRVRYVASFATPANQNEDPSIVLDPSDRVHPMLRRRRPNFDFASVTPSYRPSVNSNIHGTSRSFSLSAMSSSEEMTSLRRLVPQCFPSGDGNRPRVHLLSPSSLGAVPDDSADFRGEVGGHERRTTPSGVGEGGASGGPESGIASSSEQAELLTRIPGPSHHGVNLRGTSSAARIELSTRPNEAAVEGANASVDAEMASPSEDDRGVRRGDSDAVTRVVEQQPNDMTPVAQADATIVQQVSSLLDRPYDSTDSADIQGANLAYLAREGLLGSVVSESDFDRASPVFSVLSKHGKEEPGYLFSLRHRWNYGYVTENGESYSLFSAIKASRDRESLYRGLIASSQRKDSRPEGMDALEEELVSNVEQLLRTVQEAHQKVTACEERLARDSEENKATEDGQDTDDANENEDGISVDGSESDSSRDTEEDVEVVTASSVAASHAVSTEDRQPRMSDASEMDVTPVAETQRNASHVIDGPQHETHQSSENESSGVPESSADPTANTETTSPDNSAQTMEQRAAAVGVSLDAPANEDPDVVAAAVASTGIDPTFLAALPDDMRTEVLTQHFERLSSSQAADPTGAEGASASILSPDFLIALPPELRSEVLVQEASYRARNESGNSGNAGGVGGQHGFGADGETSQADADANEGAGGDSDLATFWATLSRELREEIFATSEDSFLAALPPEMAAEAREVRERDTGRLNAVLRHTQDSVQFPSRVRGSEVAFARTGGERGSRSNRDCLECSWAFRNNRWVRVPPAPEAEPQAVCDDECLSSLVNLLAFQSSQYGKSLLFHVLASMCKRTAARKRVLGLLFDTLSRSLSTESISVSDVAKRAVLSKEGPCSTPSMPSSSVRYSVDVPDHDRRYASKAVVIRRVLELLTNLCKNEKAIAEAIVAVTDPETTDEGDMEPASSLSISPVASLVSLLSEPLFKRSTVHQDNLLILLSTVCNSLPPAKAPAKARQDPSSDGGENTPGDATVDNTIDNAVSAGDVGNNDGAQSCDSEPVNGDVACNAAEENSTNANTDEANVKSEGTVSDAESEVFVPVHFRVPLLRAGDIRALIDVLLQDGLSDRSYQRVINVLGQVGMLPDNCLHALDELTSSSSRLGLCIAASFTGFVQKLIQCRNVHERKTEQIEKFSMAASQDELKLLRIAKAISALIKDFKGSQSDGNVSTSVGSESDFDRLRCFRELDGLWKALDAVLTEACNSHGHSPRGGSSKLPDVGDSDEGRVSALTNAVQAQTEETRGRGSRKVHSLSPLLARLSPIIESFFVYHDACDSSDVSTDDASGERASDDRSVRASEGTPQSPIAAAAGPSSASTHRGPCRTLAMEKELGVFVERHRNAINSILRVNPQLLDGSFRPAIRHAHAIDFDNKKSFFRGLIRKRSVESQAGTIRITVRRDRVFEDSYHQLRAHSADEMKGRLHVQFTGEEGIDAGGVTREWYVILARQVFDPNYALFCRSAAKGATYQPNKSSSINQDHLEYFKFVGRIFGKAIYDGQLLDAYFTRAFYKHILGVSPTYHDIEAEDPDYYKSLCWILENDVSGIIEQTFSTEYDEFGQRKTIELKPNGKVISVTEENKVEYVKLITDVKLTKAIEKQISAFKQGFNELIPFEDIRIFNEVELELLTSGLPDIDVADLKANVEYTGYSVGSPQINWFWTAVSQMVQEDLARLVMFVTGTSKVPLEGFSALQGMNGPQKFQIHRAAGDKNRLPSAHTCFNQLDLPEYESYEILTERLLCAVRETEGFGFA